MSVRGHDRQIDNIEFNVSDIPGGRRFHFIDPDGYELAVWTAQA